LGPAPPDGGATRATGASAPQNVQI